MMPSWEDLMKASTDAAEHELISGVLLNGVTYANEHAAPQSLTAEEIRTIVEQVPPLPRIVESEFLPDTDAKGNPIAGVLITSVFWPNSPQIMIVHAPKREKNEPS